MKKFLNAFNKTLAFALAIVMTVSLFSSWSLHSLAEGEVAETVAETMATPIATPAPMVAPVSTEAPTETEVPTTTEAPVATATPSVEEKFDVQATYDALMACTEYAQAEAIVNGMSEEEQQVFLNALSEEQVNVLCNYLTEIQQGEQKYEGDPIIIPHVDNSFTNVAPLVKHITTPYAFMKLRNSVGNVALTNPEKKENESVETIKSSVINADGTFTIRLEAWTKGETVTSSESVPCDIILVLDQSGSMKNKFADGEGSWVVNTKGSWNQGNGGIGANNPATGARAWGDAQQYYINLGSDESPVWQALEMRDFSWPQGANNQAYGYYNNNENLVDAAGNKVSLGAWVWVLGYQDTKSFFDPGALQNEVALAAEKTGYNYIFWQNKSYYTLKWSTGTEISRLDALKSAVTTLATNVKADAEATGVNHRIAMVGFASGSSNDGYNIEFSYQNTEVFDGKTEYTYNNGAQSHYKNALKDMSTSQADDITDSIDLLEANGGTLTDLGLELAKGILGELMNEADYANRKRIVIVFSDGEPGWSGFTTSRADSALNYSAQIKSMPNTTLYTVSVMEGASVNGNSNADRFMNYLSSNYSSMVSNMSKGENSSIVSTIDQNGNNQIDENEDSYYLTADNTSALDKIFETISKEVSTSDIDLGTKTEVKDIVSEYFEIPEGATVSLKTMRKVIDASGSVSWIEEKPAYVDPVNGAPISTIDGTTVTVTNFDYNKNFIADVPRTNPDNSADITFAGRKVIITFIVKAKDGFLGGNGVPTNESTSGVYAYNEESQEANILIENFEYPRVNVPIQDINLTVQDKNVYLLDGLSTEQMLKAVTATSNGTNLFGLTSASWEDDYVTITTTDPSTLSNLESDTEYSVTINIAPSYSAEASYSGTAATEKTVTDKGKVNVFKPVLIFKDYEVNYGAGEPSYDTENKVSIMWKHGNTVDREVVMLGNAPELALTYTPDEGAVKEEIVVTANDYHVNVSVKIGETDITANHVTFEHVDCNPANCGFDADKGEFMIHILSMPLIINKTFVEGTVPQVGETFIFTVKGTGTATSSVNMTVTLVAEKDAAGQIEVAPITINNLPIGEYKVTEDTSWNWRYKPVDESGNEITDATYTITLGAVQEVTFKNKVVNNKWIDSNAYCENTFAAVNTSGSATSTKVQVK